MRFPRHESCNPVALRYERANIARAGGCEGVATARAGLSVGKTRIEIRCDTESIGLRSKQTRR